MLPKQLEAREQLTNLVETVVDSALLLSQFAALPHLSVEGPLRIRHAVPVFCRGGLEPFELRFQLAFLFPHVDDFRREVCDQLVEQADLAGLVRLVGHG